MTGAATSALSQDEAFARIRLLRSPNIGPVSYALLLQRFGTATAALEALPDLGKRGGRSYRAAASDAIEREDMAELKDELGDLLFQVVFHSQMAQEEGLFRFEDVADAISEKMLR